MVHLLILLARAGAGKSTLANYVRDTYGARVVSLATPLKKAAQAAMGFSDTQLFGTQAEKEATDPNGARDARGNLLSARTFLQKMGTEGLRENFGRDVHLDALLYRIRESYASEIPCDDPLKDDHVVYVVDDCRFPDEVNYFLDLENEHSWVVKVICTDAPFTAGVHSSESGIDSVPANAIEATVTSARTLGTEDLIAKFEFALDTRLKPLKAALIESRAALEKRRLHAPEEGPTSAVACPPSAVAANVASIGAA